MSKEILALGQITDPNIKKALHDFAVALIASAEAASDFDGWKSGLAVALTAEGHHLVAEPAEEVTDATPRVPRRKK